MLKRSGSTIFRDQALTWHDNSMLITRDESQRTSRSGSSRETCAGSSMLDTNLHSPCRELCHVFDSYEVGLITLSGYCKTDQ
jgi:hypothetical protein